MGSDRRRAVPCPADDSPGKRLAQYSGCVANGTGPACADQTRLLLDHCATIGMMVMVDLAMPFRRIVCGGLSCGPCHPSPHAHYDVVAGAIQTCVTGRHRCCFDGSPFAFYLGLMPALTSLVVAGQQRQELPGGEALLSPAARRHRQRKCVHGVGGSESCGCDVQRARRAARLVCVSDRQQHPQLIGAHVCLPVPALFVQLW